MTPVSKTFLSCQTEALYPLSSGLSISPSLQLLRKGSNPLFVSLHCPISIMSYKRNNIIFVVVLSGLLQYFQGLSML